MKTLRLSTKYDVYIEKYYMYQYNDNSFRVVRLKACRQPGFEEIKKKKNNYIDNKNDEETERVSLSRTRRNIRELSLCNDFEYFTTFTINSNSCDRFNLTECQTLLRKKLKALKRKNNNFAYLFITEKHKDGAFHFHGLIKGITDFYINENGFLSHKLFDEIGFNSFSKIRDYNKCCNYITKYITKDCVKNEAGTVYISSRGLKKAIRTEIEPVALDWSYENDFCSIKDYNIPDMSKSDLLLFMTLPNK